jgi:hypothetical protein
VHVQRRERLFAQRRRLEGALIFGLAANRTIARPILLADVVEGSDMRVTEARDHASLALEALAQLASEAI